MRNLFIVALMGILFSGCGSVARYTCKGDFRNEVVCPGILDHLVEGAAPAAKPAAPAPACTAESGKGGWVVFRHCSKKEREEYFSKK